MPPIHDHLINIVPMLADTDNIPIESLAGTHLFDTKLDGVRALAAWDGNLLTLRNRNRRVMDNYLDLELAAVGIPGPIILDGEIITESGKFQDIAWRDKQRGPKAIKAMQQMPVNYIAFDILWHPDHGDIRHQPYSVRRELLIGLRLSQHSARFDHSTASIDPKFYDAIRAMGGEGVVAKRLSAAYSPGRRPAWLKYKAAFTVTCVGTGYEPGNGARKEFGAMHLGMIAEDGSLVPMGKVGSGFTLPETLAMKATFDNAKSAADLPIVEIQCFNRTRDGKLRMPVYLGQRSDQTLTDCSVKQLQNLPET